MQPATKPETRLPCKPEGVDLTDRMWATLCAIFPAHGPALEEVAVFGSRAQGTARPASDIDLILRGCLGHNEIVRLAGALEDSDLPVRVDLVIDGSISDPATASAIAATKRVIFPLPAA
jgi:uncharacterized protein